MDVNSDSRSDKSVDVNSDQILGRYHLHFPIFGRQHSENIPENSLQAPHNTAMTNDHASNHCTFQLPECNVTNPANDLVCNRIRVSSWSVHPQNVNSTSNISYTFDPRTNTIGSSASSPDSINHRYVITTDPTPVIAYRSTCHGTLDLPPSYNATNTGPIMDKSEQLICTFNATSHDWYKMTINFSLYTTSSGNNLQPKIWWKIMYNSITKNLIVWRTFKQPPTTGHQTDMDRKFTSPHSESVQSCESRKGKWKDAGGSIVATERSTTKMMGNGKHQEEILDITGYKQGIEADERDIDILMACWCAKKWVKEMKRWFL